MRERSNTAKNKFKRRAQARGLLPRLFHRVQPLRRHFAQEPERKVKLPGILPAHALAPDSIARRDLNSLQLLTHLVRQQNCEEKSHGPSIPSERCSFLLYFQSSLIPARTLAHENPLLTKVVGGGQYF